MKIKVCELTPEAFEPYGSYVLPDQCDREQAGTISFYPEQVVGLFEFSSMPAVDVLAFSKREFAIDVTEMHEHTEEIFGGFNTDVLFHVGPPSGKTPDVSRFKVFRLPKGGYARVKRNAWHHAPFAVGDERAVGVVILPPYTYTHDCFVVTLDEKAAIDF